MTSPPPSSRCLYCDQPLTDRKSVGRPKLFCSDGHRSADRRRRTAADPQLAAQDFALTLDRAITDSGHPAQWVIKEAKKGGRTISAPSLSGWRSGASVPYLTEDNREVLLSLERVLAKPTGHLLASLERTALAHGRRWWPEPQVPQPRHPLSEPERLRRTLEEDGFTNRGTMVLVEARDSLTIATDRRPARCHSTYRLCALRPGVTRYAVVMSVDRRNPVTLTAVRHCRVRRQRPTGRRNGRFSLLGVEFRLDRELDAYEPYELEFEAVNQPGPAERRLPMPGWILATGDPACRSQQLQLSFAGERPKQVWQCEWQRGPGSVPRPENESPAVPVRGVFERSLTNPPPGCVGFRWRWPGALEPGPATPAAGTAAEVPTR